MSSTHFFFIPPQEAESNKITAETNTRRREVARDRVRDNWLMTLPNDQIARCTLTRLATEKRAKIKSQKKNKQENKTGFKQRNERRAKHQSQLEASFCLYADHSTKTCIKDDAFHAINWTLMHQCKSASRNTNHQWIGRRGFVICFTCFLVAIGCLEGRARHARLLWTKKLVIFQRKKRTLVKDCKETGAEITPCEYCLVLAFTFSSRQIFASDLFWILAHHKHVRKR